jgi:hypothetical protein
MKALLLFASAVIAAEALLPLPHSHSKSLGKDGLAALQQEGPRGGEPRLHPLNDEELRGIYTINCLKAKQQNPRVVCGAGIATNGSLRDASPPPTRGYEHGSLGVGSYPNFRDARCNSNGEYFCDPEGLMPWGSRQKFMQDLQYFREQTNVRCGRLDSRLDPRHQDHTVTRPFNLAVVLADAWPPSDVDPVSLDRFGMILLSEWGLMPIYNGVDSGNSVNEVDSWDEYTMNCPNSAVLIILPRYRVAHVAAPSCEFLCSTRGGPEIATGVVMALDKGGEDYLTNAAEEGLLEVRRILRETTPQSLKKEDPAYLRRIRLQKWEGRIMKSDFAWNIMQRIVLVFLVALSLLALFAFAFFNLVPEPRKGIRKG